MTFGIVASSHPAFAGGTWSAVTFANSWADYGSGYAPTASLQEGDVTYVRGLIKDGTTTAGTTIASGLPAPSGRLIFPGMGTTTSTPCAFDIDASGNILTRVTTSAFAGVQAAYVDSDASVTAPTLLNSWIDHGSGYAGAGYYKDSDGNVIIQGLIKSGTTTQGTVIFTLPSGYRPAADMIFHTYGSGGNASIDVQSDGDVVVRRADPTFTSLSGIAFPTTSSWTAPTLGSSWVNFGGAFATAGYIKDASNVVHLRGLIKSGTTTQGTVIFTLPSGYRPAYDLTFIVAGVIGGNDAHAYLDVQADGDVWIRHVSSNTYLSLSDIRFPIA